MSMRGDLSKLIDDNLLEQLSQQSKDEVIKAYIESNTNSAIRNRMEGLVDYWVQQAINKELDKPENKEKLQKIIGTLIENEFKEQGFIRRGFNEMVLKRSAHEILNQLR